MDDLDALLQLEFDLFLQETPVNEWVSFDCFVAAWLFTSILFKCLKVS